MIEDAGTPGFRFAAPRAKSVSSSGLDLPSCIPANPAFHSRLRNYSHGGLTQRSSAWFWITWFYRFRQSSKTNVKGASRWSVWKPTLQIDFIEERFPKKREPDTPAPGLPQNLGF